MFYFVNYKPSFKILIIKISPISERIAQAEGREFESLKRWIFSDQSANCFTLSVKNGYYIRKLLDAELINSRADPFHKIFLYEKSSL